MPCLSNSRVCGVHLSVLHSLRPQHQRMLALMLMVVQLLVVGMAGCANTPAVGAAMLLVSYLVHISNLLATYHDTNHCANSRCLTCHVHMRWDRPVLVVTQRHQWTLLIFGQHRLCHTADMCTRCLECHPACCLGGKAVALLHMCCSRQSSGLVTVIVP